MAQFSHHTDTVSQATLNISVNIIQKYTWFFKIGFLRANSHSTKCIRKVTFSFHANRFSMLICLDVQLKIPRIHCGISVRFGSCKPWGMFTPSESKIKCDCFAFTFVFDQSERTLHIRGEYLQLFKIYTNIYVRLLFSQRQYLVSTRKKRLSTNESPAFLLFKQISMVYPNSLLKIFLVLGPSIVQL